VESGGTTILSGGSNTISLVDNAKGYPRIAWNKPAYKSAPSASVLWTPGMVPVGAAIPDDPNTIIMVISYGQSNTTGTNISGAPYFMSSAAYPGDLLMFDVAVGTPDVRAGTNRFQTSNNVALVGTNLIGFTDLVPVVANWTGAGDGYLGQTYMESFCYRLAQDCEENFGWRPPVLAFAGGVGGATLYNLLKPSMTNYVAPASANPPYTDLITAVTAAQRLAAARGKKLYVACVLWWQGEGGSGNTSLGDGTLASIADYASNLAALKSQLWTDISAITGQSASPAWIGIQHVDTFDYETTGSFGNSAALAAGTLAALIPAYPAFDLGWVGADYLHMNTLGVTAFGEYLYKAAKATLFGGSGALVGSCRPVSAAFLAGHNQINVTCQCPAAPIVLDTSLGDSPSGWGVHGVTYFDNSNPYNANNISSVAVLGDGLTIQITLTSAPSGASPYVAFAGRGFNSLGGAISGQIGNHARTCFRDSDATPSRLIAGYTMRNWMIGTQLPVTG